MGKFNIHDWQAKQRQKQLNEQDGTAFDNVNQALQNIGTGTFTPQGGVPGTDGGLDVY